MEAGFPNGIQLINRGDWYREQLGLSGTGWQADMMVLALRCLEIFRRVTALKSANLSEWSLQARAGRCPSQSG